MKTPYKMESHRFFPFGGKVPYPVCVNCGMVRLKNLVSDWAVTKGCNYKDHPEFRRKLKESVEQANA